MQTIRQYLKNLSPDTLKKLFDLSNLSEMECWVLRYAFIERRMRENTCMKLNIGKTKYHCILNEALIKVTYTINNLDKIRTL